MSSSWTLEPAISVQQRETTAKWKWTGLIVGFLGVQVVMSAVAIFLANSDPSHAVIPNYHQQALEYDQVLAARQASQRLGWIWTIDPGMEQTAPGKHSLTVRIRDAAGKPITNAEVTLQISHHARGNDRQSIVLAAEREAGTYRGQARIDRNGVWQVDLSVHRQNDLFIDRRESFWSFNKP